MLRSDLRSEGMQEKAASSYRTKTRLESPETSTTFSKLLQIHPFDELRVGEHQHQ